MPEYRPSLEFEPRVDPDPVGKLAAMGGPGDE